MVLPLRMEMENAWYHVTARGNKRRSNFRNDEGISLAKISPRWLDGPLPDGQAGVLGQNSVHVGSTDIYSMTHLPVS